jgi:hypothetical protein
MDMGEGLRESREARTFSALDERRKNLDAADPLKPGMWSVDGKIGRMPTDSDEMWAAVDRAAAKYGSPAQPDEALRYARALKTPKG